MPGKHKYFHSCHCSAKCSGKMLKSCCTAELKCLKKHIKLFETLECYLNHIQGRWNSFLCGWSWNVVYQSWLTMYIKSISFIQICMVYVIKVDTWNWHNIFLSANCHNYITGLFLSTDYMKWNKNLIWIFWFLRILLLL